MLAIESGSDADAATLGIPSIQTAALPDAGHGGAAAGAGAAVISIAVTVGATRDRVPRIARACHCDDAAVRPDPPHAALADEVDAAVVGEGEIGVAAKTGGAGQLTLGDVRPGVRAATRDGRAASRDGRNARSRDAGDRRGASADQSGRADLVRSTGQLTDANSGRHLWGVSFEGDLIDVFDLQDRIT